jgi:hypothetical protein
MNTEFSGEDKRKKQLRESLEVTHFSLNAVNTLANLMKTIDVMQDVYNERQDKAMPHFSIEKAIEEATAIFDKAQKERQDKAMPHFSIEKAIEEATAIFDKAQKERHDKSIRKLVELSMEDNKVILDRLAEL